MPGPSTANLQSYAPSRKVYDDASGVENAFLAGLGNANLNPLADIEQGINSGLDLATKANKFLDSIGPQAAENKQLDLEIKRAQAASAQANSQLTQYHANIAAASNTKDATNAVLEAQKKERDLTFANDQAVTLSDAYTNLPQIADQQSFSNYVGQSKFNTLRSNSDFQNLVIGQATKLLGTTNDPTTQIQIVRTAEAAATGATKGLINLLPAETQTLLASPKDQAQIDKDRAEADKYRADARKLGAEANQLNQPPPAPPAPFWADQVNKGSGADNAPLPGLHPGQSSVGAPASQPPLAGGLLTQGASGTGGAVTSTGASSTGVSELGAPPSTSGITPPLMDHVGSSGAEPPAGAPSSQQQFPTPEAQAAHEAALKKDAELPLSEQIYYGRTKQLQDKVDYAKARIKATNPRIKDDELEKQALEQAKAIDFSPKEIEDFKAYNDSTRLLAQNADRVQGSLNRLKDLMAKHSDIIVPLGAGTSVSTALAKLDANISSDPNDPERQVLNELGQLDSVGAALALQMVQESGGGKKSIDSDAELNFYRKLGTASTNSLAQNIEVMNLITGKLQERQDRAKIVSTYRKLNLGYEDGQAAADQFDERFPTTQIGHDQNGQPYVVPNNKDRNPFAFIDKKEDLASQLGANRTAQGRLRSAPPVTVTGHAEQLAAQLNPSTFKQPNPADIPEVQPKGPNDATILGIAWQESKGNLGAIGPETKYGQAKGPYQFIDATGQKLWSDMRLPGDYNPHDPIRSTQMATQLMTTLLDGYNHNTRLALAAYNYNPKGVDHALDKAQKAFGNTDWNSVKGFLPEETQKYVKKIMGDGAPLDLTTAKASPQQTLAAIDSIPSADAQKNARLILSDEGNRALVNTSGIQNFHQAAGSLLDPIITAFASANPFRGPDTANAQELSPEEQSNLQKDLHAAVQGSAESGDQASPAISGSMGSSTSSSKSDSLDWNGKNGTFNIEDYNPFDISTAEAQTLTPQQTASLKAQAADKKGRELIPPMASGDSGGGPPASFAVTSPQMGDPLNIPADIQSFALGAARAMMFGRDVSFGAYLRMMWHGESYDQALAKSIKIRDEFQKAHPNFYGTGEFVGLFGAGGEIGLAGKGLRMGLGSLGFGTAAAGAATAAPTAVEGGLAAAKTATTLKSLMQSGAVGGATFGALTGSGDAPAGLANEVKGGLIGAGVGAGVGAAGGALMKIGGLIVGTKTVQATLDKIMQTGPAQVAMRKLANATAGSVTDTGKAVNLLATGKPKSITFTPEQTDILDHMRGTTDQELAQIENVLATQGPNGTATLASEGGPILSKDLLEQVSKDPVTALTRTKQFADDQINKELVPIKEVLDQHTDDIPRNLAYDSAARVVENKIETAEAPKVAAAAQAYNNAEDVLATQPERINALVHGTSTPPDRVEVYQEAAQAVQNQLTAIERLKDEIRKPYYKEAEKFALDKHPVILDYKQTHKDVTGSFQSPEVQNQLYRPIVRRAIADAKGYLGSNEYPDLSFEVLQTAKSYISKWAHDGDRLAAEAIGPLTDAMHAENPAYAKADKAFQPIAQHIDDLKTKAFKLLHKYGDPAQTIDSTKIGEDILKIGPVELKSILQPNREALAKIAPGASQAALDSVDAADQYLKDSLVAAAKTRVSDAAKANSVGRQPGQPVTFPNIAKQIPEDSLNTVLGGGKEGTQLLNDLSQEKLLSDASSKIVGAGSIGPNGEIPTALDKLLSGSKNSPNPNLKNEGAIYEQASKPAQGLATRFYKDLNKVNDPGNVRDLKQFGEDLFKQGAAEIEAGMKTLSPAEQRTFQNSARAYILDKFAERPKRLPETTQKFPELTGKDFEGKLNAIFSNNPQGAKDIMAVLERGQKASNFANASLNQDAGTAGNKGNVGPDVLKAAAATAYAMSTAGSNPYQSGASAAYAGSMGLRALNTALRNSKIDSEVAMAGKVSQFLTDRPAQLEFVRNVLTFANKTKPEVVPVWEKVLQILSKPEAQAAGGAAQVAVSKTSPVKTGNTPEWPVMTPNKK